MNTILYILTILLAIISGISWTKFITADRLDDVSVLTFGLCILTPPLCIGLILYLI